MVGAIKKLTGPRAAPRSKAVASSRPAPAKKEGRPGPHAPGPQTHPSAPRTPRPASRPAREGDRPHKPSAGPSGRSEARPVRGSRPDHSKEHRRGGGRRPAFEPIEIPPREPDDAWDPSSYPVPPEEGKTRFAEFQLARPLLHAIADMGFQYATPIQVQSLPDALGGRDIFGQAQTGTGKTAAFLLAIYQRFLTQPAPEQRPGTPRALVLAPTRELAMQIERDARAIARYSGLAVACVYGGSDMDRQRRSLAGRVDLLIATPGRLLDFHSRHDVHLNRVEVLVIDEADRMLDMGFIPDVRRIIYSTPHKDRRQTLLYSATLSDPVRRLASNWTRDPARIEVAPDHIAVETVDQRVYIATASEKFPLLYNLITKENWDRALLFVNRRGTAERVCEMLRKCGIEALLISGALSQGQRTRALEDFRAGKARVLVATDVAGRGIHIEGVSHVVNYNIPLDPEDYVHRIGRTGRAGASGTSVTFACEEESFYLPPIETYIGRPLKCTLPEVEWLQMPPGMTAPTIEDRPPRSDRPRRDASHRSHSPRRPSRR
ncbi:MAG: DEAD/DEAH box helicase [Kiritimatiellae bacterium]|nr:DEAD/DEAH box helicase [Kiritimatiellia bacterium]